MSHGQLNLSSVRYLGLRAALKCWCFSFLLFTYKINVFSQSFQTRSRFSLRQIHGMWRMLCETHLEMVVCFSSFISVSPQTDIQHVLCVFCRVWTRGTLLTSLLLRLSVSSPRSGPPGRVPQTSRTCYCGALSLAQIHAWHSAAILPAINLTFLHHQGLHILTMTDTPRWKRLPELRLLLLLLEDLAERPGSTWRVRRKEQRGGWHQSCPGRLSEDNCAFDTEQRAAGESTRVQSTEPKHLHASNSVE